MELTALIFSIGGVVGWFFGEPSGFFYALLAFVVLDYFTGVITGIATKQLSSAAGFKGIAKKVFILALVGIGNVLDTQIVKDGSAIKTAIIFFYLVNEAISIIENAAILGLPIPPKLINVLKQLKNESDKND